MLVDINLLPQKEEKSRSLLMLYILIVLVLAAGLFSIFYFSSLTEKKVNTVQQEITATKQLLEQAKMQLADLSQSPAVNQLENAVKWAEQNRAKTVPLLQHLTALLPDRGYIKNFSFQLPQTVKLTVQFDTNREAAYFLNNLNEAEWITEANLESLNIQRLEEDNADLPEKYVPRTVAVYDIKIGGKFAELSAGDSGGDAS